MLSSGNVSSHGQQTTMAINYTQNFTYDNFTSPNPSPVASIPRYRFAINCIVIAATASSIGILTIDMKILNRCRKIPFQMKWLCNAFIISGILCDFNLMILCVLTLALDARYAEIIHYVRVITTTSLICASWGCSALMAVERLAALSFPLVYANLVKRYKLITLLIIVLTVTSVIPTIFSLYSMFTQCDQYLQTCNIHVVFSPSRVYFAILFSVFLVFNTVAYVKLSNIIRRHTLEIKNVTFTATKSATVQTDRNTCNKQLQLNNKTVSVTSTINSILLAFVCLHLIPIFHSIAFNVIPTLQKPEWQSLFQILSFLCSCLNSLLSSYMYLWKIQECKMIFLQMFMSWNTKSREMAEEIRRSVYNIVIVEKKTDLTHDQ